MSIQFSKKAIENIKSAVDGTALSQSDKDNVKKVIDEEVAKGGPLDWDKWIYRMVVAALGLAILSCLSFVFVLSLSNTDSNLQLPEIFMAVGSAAVGALAGLLAPSPGRGGND